MLKNGIKFLLKKLGYKLVLKDHDKIEEINIPQKLLIKTSQKYSMTNERRLWSLLQSMQYVIQNKIDGEFVECGVWKGGNIILFKKYLEEKKIKKNIYAYDTYDGMPKPGIFDYKLGYFKKEFGLNIYNVKKKNWNKIDLNTVKSNILNECDDIDNIHFIKGLVQDTLTKNDNLPEKISILRLDTDFYESSKKELEILYPRLSKGGILILDDYGTWTGVKQAVDEFFEKKGEIPFLHFVDYGCRLLIKTENDH